MALIEFSFTDINDKEVESAYREQTAHMCNLILLYTFCKLEIHDLKRHDKG